MRMFHERGLTVERWRETMVAHADPNPQEAMMFGSLTLEQLFAIHTEISTCVRKLHEAWLVAHENDARIADALHTDAAKLLETQIMIGDEIRRRVDSIIP